MTSTSFFLSNQTFNNYLFYLSYKTIIYSIPWYRALSEDQPIVEIMVMAWEKKRLFF